MGRAIALVACVCAPVVAAAAATPIPLQQPTGYRDYCDGMGKVAKRSCPRGCVPQRLWRQLSFPPVGPHGECPVSKPHRISKRFAPVLGSKPMYVGTYGSAGDYSAVEMPSPAPYGSPAYGTGWSITKILLTMRKELHQPLLIRGKRLDDAGWLGFSGPAGHRPFAAMQFPSTRKGIDEGKFKAFGMGVWATAPGCYGVQIDGKNFRRDVVFRVVFSS